MAEGTAGTHRPDWMWTELFRTFQIALDPKKLLLAAAGILAMAGGTWFMSWAFFAMRSEPTPAAYSLEAYQKANPNVEIEVARKRVADDLDRARERYRFAASLAGPATDTRPNGVFRRAPWNDDRGRNPFLVVAGLFSGQMLYQPGQFWDWALNEQMPVLLEPLVRFLRPVLAILNPNADFFTRVYLLFVIAWTVAVWAFFGGAITRIAVLQIAGKDPPTLVESMRFVAGKYVHYFAAPLVPVLFIAGIAIITILFGLIHLIPFVGDLVDGILWPIPLLMGFAQALLLVGLVGYPLMFPTISAEGSDTFDALSRSYNYVYQSPWRYIWSCLVAVAYGMVVVFFVAFMGSLVVFLTKWSLSQTPGTNYFANRRVDYLFSYAPTTYQWRDILLEQPDLRTNMPIETRVAFLDQNFGWWNYISARLVQFWLILLVMLIVGYGYSYFFTAGTVIYLLMRQSVDDTEFDEVYAEEDLADEPLLPPPPPPTTTGPPVQMVDAPTLRVPSAPPAGDGVTANP